MLDYDVTVVGGGPAGYVAAIRAAQLGGKVAIVEQDTMGGTCLNRGCIPAKTYLHEANLIENIRHLGKRGIKIDGEITFELESLVAAKDGIVKKLTNGVRGLLASNGVEQLSGHATLRNHTLFVNDVPVSTKKIIICTGSTPIVPDIPGTESEKVIGCYRTITKNRPYENFIGTINCFMDTCRSDGSFFIGMIKRSPCRLCRPRPHDPTR